MNLVSNLNLSTELYLGYQSNFCCFFFFSSIPYFGDQRQCLGMKLLDNLCMQVAFVTGPEERSEPLGGVPAKPYKAFNSGTFRLFLVVPFFKVNE